MSKKQYTTPQVSTHEVQPAQMLALSIIQGATADPSSDVLVKGNDWDVFGQDTTDADADTDTDTFAE